MNHIVRSEKLIGLFHNGKQITFQKNETILRARETPRGVYLIDSGMIKIYSLSKQNDEHVHHFFGPGDFFPIIWPFRRSIRNMYYETLSEVTVWLIERQVFRDFLDANPDVTAEMLDILLDRYNLYTGRIDNLLYSDARERSAYRLLSLANRFGVRQNGDIVINTLITHEDLAHSINMTRETFGRTISRLQEKGILNYDDQRHIVICDLEALAHIIGEEEVNAMWPGLLEYSI